MGLPVSYDVSNKNRGIFPKVDFSAQKEDTRAILLKTALVRVSCIQIIQVRDQTTAKVFGKVDTFWTYQASTKKVSLGVDGTGAGG